MRNGLLWINFLEILTPKTDPVPLPAAAKPAPSGTQGILALLPYTALVLPCLSLFRS